MPGWYGYFKQDGVKTRMNFNYVYFNERTRRFKAKGYDECGPFKFDGFIKNRKVNAIKRYPSWHIYYSGNYDQEFNEICGYWGFRRNQPCDKFKVRKVKNDKISDFRSDRLRINGMEMKISRLDGLRMKRKIS